MANIKKTIALFKKWEGGFANDPDDAGGATNSGITLTTFRHYFGQDKTVEDLKNMTDKQWEYIFRKGFWNKAKCDQIEDDRIAMLVADMCWGSGPVTAIKKVQQCLGCEADGVVGPVTLAALNKQRHNYVFYKLWCMRYEWFHKIAEKGNNKKYLKGWLNRLDDIK